MAWCVGIGYGNASLVAGPRALQPTGEEGLYTASWRGVRGPKKRGFGAPDTAPRTFRCFDGAGVYIPSSRGPSLEREAERTAELEWREAARKAREAADRDRHGPRYPKNPDCPTGNPICYLLLVFAISLVGCALEFEPACVVAKIYNVRPMHSHPADH